MKIFGSEVSEAPSLTKSFDLCFSVAVTVAAPRLNVKGLISSLYSSVVGRCDSGHDNQEENNNCLAYVRIISQPGSCSISFL